MWFTPLAGGGGAGQGEGQEPVVFLHVPHLSSPGFLETTLFHAPVPTPSRCRESTRRAPGLSHAPVPRPPGSPGLLPSPPVQARPDAGPPGGLLLSQAAHLQADQTTPKYAWHSTSPPQGQGVKRPKCSHCRGGTSRAAPQSPSRPHDCHKSHCHWVLQGHFSPKPTTLVGPCENIRRTPRGASCRVSEQTPSNLPGGVRSCHSQEETEGKCTKRRTQSANWKVRPRPNRYRSNGK